MSKDKLGKKRVCPTTGKKFYDLNKDPVVSPYTGEILNEINIEDLEKEKTEVSTLETEVNESEVESTDENIKEIKSDYKTLKSLLSTKQKVSEAIAKEIFSTKNS